MKGSPLLTVLMILGYGLLLVGIVVVEEGRIGILQMRSMLAYDEVRVYYERRSMAKDADIGHAVQLLSTLVEHNPAGPRRITSVLDMLAERVRREVVNDIIENLRQKTGDDLGDNPDAWIQKYAEKKPQG